MKANKILCAILCVLMVFGIFPVSAAEPDIPCADAAASSMLIDAGDTFDVTVSIDAEGVNGYLLMMTCTNCTLVGDPVEVSAVKADMFRLNINKDVAAGYHEESVDISGEAVQYTFSTSSNFTGNARVEIQVRVIDPERNDIINTTEGVDVWVEKPVYAHVSAGDVAYPYSGYVDFVVDTAVTIQGIVLCDFACSNPAVVLDLENAVYSGSGNVVIKDVNEDHELVVALDEVTAVSGTVIRIPYTAVGSEFGTFTVSCSAQYARDTEDVFDMIVTGGNINVVMLRDGDVDGKDGVNASDAVYLLWNQFYPEEYPIDSYRDCDFNSDGKVNISDAVYLLWYILYPLTYPIA